MQKNTQFTNPLVSVAATGFASPADDFLEDDIFHQLGDYLVPRPHSTFYFRLRSQDFHPWAMRGDLLVVDRSLEVKSGHLVVALVEGQYVLGELSFVKAGVQLHLEKRSRFFSWEEGLEIFGVVSFVIRPAKNKASQGIKPEENSYDRSC